MPAVDKTARDDLAARWVNLAAEKLGARAINCSDEFFAPSRRMLREAPPIFIADKYDANGKWMDGWETRRKRGGGHDWCVVKLARAGVLRAAEIDTAHFIGNHPPAAALQACNVASGEPGPQTDWVEILPRVELNGDQTHRYTIHSAAVYSHVRVNIFPDGGIARLRVYGEPKVDWRGGVARGQLADLAYALNGAVALQCNNEHFGAMRNLLSPGRGVNMGDGWETRRRRTPGNDWVIIALAARGVIKRAEVDTAHFKGNYPERCSLQGADLTGLALRDLARESAQWAELLPPLKLRADRAHVFDKQIVTHRAVTHVRFNIYPDGGVSRVRLFGAVEI